MAILKRSRLSSLAMFFVFVIVSHVLDGVLEFVVAKANVLDLNDRTWRPSAFIWFETASVVAAIAASLLVCWLQGRRLRELGYAGTGALRQALWGAFWGLVAPTA